MNNASIKIKGYSGCSVQIITKDKNILVKKTSKDVEYNSRLFSQFQKHKSYLKQSYNNITSPSVVDDGYDESNNYYYTMEYMPHSDMVSYLNICGTDGLIKLHRDLSDFIHTNIKYSYMKNVLPEFNSKMSSVEKSLSSDKSLDLFEQFNNEVSKLDKVEIPIGKCHGDLTLSNMLISFDGKTKILIDFLDCFIESPIHDIVKIRQDTVHKWSIYRCENEFDQCRLNMVLDKLDQLAKDEFFGYDFVCKYYKFFQILNLFRILAYARDEETHNYLVQCVERELDG